MAEATSVMESPSLYDKEPKAQSDVPPGYKRTEVGVIPEDWEVIRLGDVGEVSMCKRILKQQTRPSGDIPFYKIGTFGGRADAFISQEIFEEYKRKFSFPKQGDILISAAGTIGKTVVYDGKPAYFQDSNIVWIDNDEKKILNSFLFYVYQKTKWRTEDTTISRLYNDNLKKIKVPKPPIQEQRAIAKALSDTDALIDSLKTLLEKKRAIKTAAMQQLLTGKIRLPGFSGEWEVKRLGEVADVKKGTLITEKNTKNGKIPVIGAGIGTTYFHDTPNRGKETITISASGANAGFVSFHDYPIFASDCSTIEKSENYNIKYIYYSLKNIQHEIFRLQKGGAQPHVYPEQIKKISINFPPIDEQEKIANVLSDMDAEVEALEKRLEKTRMLKEGMMRELLTGKIRLIEQG